MQLFFIVSITNAPAQKIIEISCNITVVQNFLPNSLNFELFDKKVYKATHNAKLGIAIEK